MGVARAPTQFPGAICLCGAKGGDNYGLRSSVWTLLSLQSSQEPTPTLTPSSASCVSSSPSGVKAMSSLFSL